MLVKTNHLYLRVGRQTLILEDGLYNFVKIVTFTAKSIVEKTKLKNTKKGERCDLFVYS
jgi:hypothetical protein